MFFWTIHAKITLIRVYIDVWDVVLSNLVSLIQIATRFWQPEIKTYHRTVRLITINLIRIDVIGKWALNKSVSVWVRSITVVELLVYRAALLMNAEALVWVYVRSTVSIWAISILRFLARENVIIQGGGLLVTDYLSVESLQWNRAKWILIGEINLWRFTFTQGVHVFVSTDTVNAIEASCNLLIANWTLRCILRYYIHDGRNAPLGCFILYNLSVSGTITLEQEYGYCKKGNIESRHKEAFGPPVRFQHSFVHN